MSHIDAASLVAGLKRGDEGATQALVDHYYERILGYLFRMLQQRQSAEDVCQETFVRAMQRINQLSDPPALKAWLYRIATHLAYDYLRQRPQDASFDDAGEGLPAEMAHNPPLVERLYVADLLAQLEEEHRAVIVLRFYEDLGLPAISEVLGIPLGTVKSRLHYALRKLRENVQKEAEEVDQHAFQGRRKTNPSHVG